MAVVNHDRTYEAGSIQGKSLMSESEIYITSNVQNTKGKKRSSRLISQICLRTNQNKREPDCKKSLRSKQRNHVTGTVCPENNFPVLQQ